MIRRSASIAPPDTLLLFFDHPFLGIDPMPAEFDEAFRLNRFFIVLVDRDHVDMLRDTGRKAFELQYGLRSDFHHSDTDRNKERQKPLSNTIKNCGMPHSH